MHLIYLNYQMSEHTLDNLKYAQNIYISLQLGEII